MLMSSIKLLKLISSISVHKNILKVAIVVLLNLLHINEQERDIDRFTLESQFISSTILNQFVNAKNRFL